MPSWTGAGTRRRTTGRVARSFSDTLALLRGTTLFVLPPDWVGRVVSPRTEKYDRTDKLLIYARENVGWVWLVDPLQRTLEVLRLGESGWIIRASARDDARVRAEPFDAIELDLSMLWADVVLP